MAFSKFYNSKPKQTRKTWNKTPSGISGLMSSALARHNIGRQVSSAMIVTKADDILRNIIEMHMKPDVKVLSYKQASLIVACRHPAAVHAMQPICEVLKAKVEEAIPDAQIISVVARMHPEEWTEVYE